MSSIQEFPIKQFTKIIYNENQFANAEALLYHSAAATATKPMVITLEPMTVLRSSTDTSPPPSAASISLVAGPYFEEFELCSDAIKLAKI